MIVTYMTGALFIIMTGIMIAASIKFRASAGARAHYDRGDTKKDGMKGLIISTVIFLAVDGTLLYRSHEDLQGYTDREGNKRAGVWNFPEATKDNPNADVLRVEVLAQQWAWNFRYAGADKLFNTPDDIVTLNDFRVPENKKVLIQMTSKDVIHSFFLANCRMKRDANPGEITRMWFETKPGTAGEYQVTCAEMCGYAHYLMQAKFHVLTDAQWAKWETEATKWSEIAYDAEKRDQQWGWEWTPKRM